MRWVIIGLVIWWIIVDPSGAADVATSISHGITAFFQHL